MMQIAYDGIVFGILYALVAIGIVLIYRATGVLNLAQGAVATTAGYLAWHLTSAFQLAPLSSLVVATVVGGVLGAAVGVGINLFMPGKPALVRSVATFGFALILQWFNRVAFGTRPRRLAPPLDANWQFAGGVMNGRDLAVVAFGILAILGVYLLINRTTLGLRMRALAEDGDTARLYGISVWRVTATSWFIGSALASLSGVLVTIFIQIDHQIAMTLMIQSFGAMVLGGFGSVGGALLGGVVLGLGSSGITAFLSSDLKNTIVLGFVLVVLILRPSGLLGGPRFKAAEGRETAQGPAVPSSRSAVLDWGIALFLVAMVPVLSGFGFPLPMITLALLLSTAIAVMGVSFVYYFQHRITLGQGVFVTFCVYFLHVAVSGWNVGLSIPWLILAVLATSLVAALIGWITLRLDGFYFAVTTLFLPFGIAEMLGQMGALTNGQAGIPSPEVAGLAGSSASPAQLYLQAALMFLSVGVFLLAILRSRIGLVWVAIRDTSEAVEATGINPVPYRVLAFGISGAVAAIGGYLVALTLSFSSPEQFGMHWSILLLLAAFAGGSRLLVTGSLVGAGLIILVPQLVSGQGGVSDLVLGLTLLLILSLSNSSPARLGLWPRGRSRVSIARTGDIASAKEKEA